MPELRTARENARLEIGSQRGRNSHQIGVLGIYDLQGLSCGRTELLVADMRFPPTATGPPRKHKPYVIHVYSRQTMVGGAAEPRLQATHRDRCTDSRARMSPRGVDSLASSLTAREGRPLAGAGALRSSLDGRWLGL